jgi:aerobic-type carbon monoxide dehydrogenase small subunit (CoxS/CutS family)
LHEKDSTIIFVRMADGVRFILNDQPVEVSDVSPMTTLLDWLRDHRGLKGTKEGCAEGDCGACTVVLERADGRREAINACIALLGQIDGQAVRTVEGLRRPDGTAHPVQAALADADATQCGGRAVSAGHPDCYLDTGTRSDAVDGAAEIEKPIFTAMPPSAPRNGNGHGQPPLREVTLQDKNGLLTARLHFW